jgi:23S rRNA (uracil1939-C5)-methyltransferase
VSASPRDLFRRPLEAASLTDCDGVVFDPPRAGAAAQAAEIARAQVPRVAAVSCNPATLARDLATLCAAGYRVDWVAPVDQFRWSAHLEAVAALSLAR